MRVKFPLLRTRYIPATRAPVLSYGVALLSTALALIPALLFHNIVESRLAVFGVAVMVSAWYGGWKPGLAATAFALTVCSYFALTGNYTPGEYRHAVLQLALFIFIALLICWFNGELRAAQEGLLRSESNFRSLVTNAPYGIYQCDAKGTLLDANPALLSMLGYGSASELLGRHVGTLYADTQQWFQLADCLRSFKEFNGLVGEWLRKDGSSIRVRLSGRTIRNKDNTVSYELFAADVTQQGILEQQLRQSQKMEAIGRLAGGVAHDFNNLLMVISGYSEFLLERLGPDPKLRVPAQEISAAGERASSLTRQLLAFSRKQMLSPKVLDLNAIVTENLKMLTRLIGEDIELLMIPGAELGAVKADPGQIAQVIMNLAVNARDAMPRGGKLTIATSNITVDAEYARLHAPLTAGQYVMLAISDNGVGMNAETQTHIFEPFFTTKGLKGTGLGLSTVYGIVKQSGGYVWVDSEPGKGASFQIYLPRASRADERIPPEVTVKSTKPEPALETILVVEDGSELRRLVREDLENQGYTVLEAGDGAAAIEVSKAHPGSIHLLLTDIIMPGMNGSELARRLSILRPEMKVLFMSGYTDAATAHEGMLEEGIALLRKPFALSTLRAKVREKLSSPLRAQRFNLQLPLKYRLAGAGDWRKGTTENISRSGLLFRAEEVIPPKARLEINLVLPPQIAGLSATEVFCRGEVVRALEPERPAMSPALAAKILEYKFQYRSQQPQG